MPSAIKSARQANLSNRVCSRAALARVPAGAKREPGRAKHEEDERGLKPRDYILVLTAVPHLPLLGPAPSRFGKSQSCIVLQAIRVYRGIARIFCGHLPGGCDVVNALAGSLRCLHVAQEFAIESDVLLEIGHRHLRAVAGNDGVHVFERVVPLLQTICNQSGATAVIRIEERKVFAGKDVACMNGSQRWE